MLSHAWLGVPTGDLLPCRPSMGASLRSEVAKENISGGAETACRRKESWPA